MVIVGSFVLAAVDTAAALAVAAAVDKAVVVTDTAAGDHTHCYYYPSHRHKWRRR